MKVSGNYCKTSANIGEFVLVAQWRSCTPSLKFQRKWKKNTKENSLELLLCVLFFCCCVGDSTLLPHIMLLQCRRKKNIFYHEVTRCSRLCCRKTSVYDAAECKIAKKHITLIHRIHLLCANLLITQENINPLLENWSGVSSQLIAPMSVSWRFATWMENPTKKNCIAFEIAYVHFFLFVAKKEKMAHTHIYLYTWTTWLILNKHVIFWRSHNLKWYFMQYVSSIFMLICMYLFLFSLVNVFLSMLLCLTMFLVRTATISHSFGFIGSPI